MKRTAIKLFGLVFALFLVFSLSVASHASGDLDEILNYDIRVEVNSDATLTLTYHVDWKVLDSDSEGPLDWVQIGIPNRHYVSMRGLSSTVDDISFYGFYGSTSVRIDLDRKYYKDEVASFDFEIVQDYMYEMNLLTDGETAGSMT